MKPRIALILFAFCALPDARAAVITNLDRQPQPLEVETVRGFGPVTLAAGETYRVPGKLVVRYRGREVHMNNDEEFAIWPNRETGGDFGPQMRETRGKGNLQ